MRSHTGALLVVCIALALAWRRNLPLKRTAPADPAEVPSFKSSSARSHHLKAEQSISVITGKRKNHLTWLPAANATAPFNAQIIVLGDSYADDLDMDFVCWPAQVAMQLGVSMLNMAHGGSESKDAREQLARAVQFMQANDFNIEPRKAVLIVHSGGNDILHALWNPLSLLTLVADLWRFRIWKMQEFAFAEKVAVQIAKELDELLADAGSRGFSHVVVSELPISPVIPLARLLVRMLTWGDAAFVSEVLGILAGTARERLAAALATSARKHGITVDIFQEGARLEELATASLADRFGVGETFGLLGSSFRRLFRLQDEPEKRFWLDGHHPGHAAHVELAKSAASMSMLKSLRVT